VLSARSLVRMAAVIKIQNPTGRWMRRRPVVAALHRLHIICRDQSWVGVPLFEALLKEKGTTTEHSYLSLI
jgi:hypothetical protein